MIDVKCLKDVLYAIMKFDKVLEDMSSLRYQWFLINQLHFAN